MLVDIYQLFFFDFHQRFSAASSQCLHWRWDALLFSHARLPGFWLSLSWKIGQRNFPWWAEKFSDEFDHGQEAPSTISSKLPLRWHGHPLQTMNGFSVRRFWRVLEEMSHAIIISASSFIATILTWHLLRRWTGSTFSPFQKWEIRSWSVTTHWQRCISQSS